MYQNFYFKFIWSSTCFGRHTAHHHEPKTALAASGFAYVEGCWPSSCWTLSASSNYTANNPRTVIRYQNQRLLVQFSAPDDGRCVAETCWASYIYEIKFLIHCCILLDFLCEQGNKLSDWLCWPLCFAFYCYKGRSVATSYPTLKNAWKSQYSQIWQISLIKITANCYNYPSSP